jgi:ketohexokinase
MARILGVGIATLDIINTVAEYPAEDAEVRVLSQRVARGGNATNTLVVLSRLGHGCAWAGVLPQVPDARHVLEDLQRNGIDLHHCRRLAGGKVPTSYVSLSRATGSRTIVHYRDLSELSLADFAAIDLEGYDWVHFEGRNVTETAGMLRRVRDLAPQLRCSLEVEKPRPDIESLFPFVDLLLCSRDYARHRGFTMPEDFLASLHTVAGHAVLSCTWGREGAVIMDPQGEMLHCPAEVPERVVDTLGAGDTYNAGMVDGMVRGLPLADTLTWACRLAGRKCAQLGLDGLDVGEAPYGT